ncbi:MAG: hypothetical protein ACE14T_08045 [Syntrophales bacterium]
MGTINLEDIRTGMILEKDVRDRSGRVLLGAGHTVSEKHLRIFKMWGVTEADIHDVRKEEVAAEAAARLDPIKLREVEDQVRELFRHADMQHPFNTELFRLLTFRLTKRETRRSAP